MQVSTLSQRLDRARQEADCTLECAQLVEVAGCQYVHCDRSATHRHSGVDLCLDHVLRVMQWRSERGAA